MKIRSSIIIVFFSVMAFIAQAQNEIHFSQFEMAPIQLNPALAGDFQGTYRVGGIYRDQWFSVVEEFGQSFKTADLFVDVNVIRGLRKQDWISVGLGYSVLDRAGSLGSSEESSGGLKNSFFNMGAAYHLANKKRTDIFTFGIQRSSVNTTIPASNLIDRVNVQTGGISMDAQKVIDKANEDGLAENSFSDWQFGLVYNKRAKNSDFKIGLSASRLFKPRFSIAGSSTNIKPLIAAFAEYRMPIGRSGTWLKPSLLYMNQGPASEVTLQGRLGRSMNDNLSINGGLGFRTGDAVQILLGADFKQYKIGASYDINISGLSAASSTVGSFELALIYIGSINKKPKIKPIVICPRL